MPLRDNNIWLIVNRTNWESIHFLMDKAYVCSFFSKIAYEHIPEFELKQSSRIKIVPSFEYAEMFKQGKSLNIREALRRMDFGDVFIIETPLVIIIGIRTHRVTIVSIRGTVALNDWIVNFNIKKSEFITHSSIRFHKGFYQAIFECFDELYTELEKSKAPIYITGHSLGGAMSAILHANWGEDPLSLRSTYFYHYRKPHIQTHSCYTFGMPRYGNRAAVNFLPNPFHLYNNIDVVPTIPPEWCGFKSCNEEFEIAESQIIKTQNRRSINFFKWLHRVTLGGGISSHAIELYNERIKAHVNI